jgi:hypothetical protein
VKIPLLSISGVGIVCICRTNQTESERVDTKHIFERQTFLKAITNHGCRMDARGFLALLTRGKKLLKPAFFISCAEGCGTLGVTLYLKHFDDGL